MNQGFETELCGTGACQRLYTVQQQQTITLVQGMGTQNICYIQFNIISDEPTRRADHCRIQ